MRVKKKRGRKKAVDKEPEDKSVVVEDTEQKPKVAEKRKRGRQKMTPTDQSFFKTIVIPKTSPVVLTPKRRRTSNKANPDSKIFTQKEKKVFYECLKENGISCLNDESLLEQLFPNRSMPEIKAMIDGFSRKAQDLNRRTEDSIETDPNASKQPIEKWIDLIHQLVPNSSKKDDISAILIDLLEEYGNELPPEELFQSDEDLLSPNYRTVFECISAALNGKYAKQMKPINAFVVVKLIEELKQLIKSDLNMSELSFLKSGIWWQTPNMTNAQRPNGDMFKAIASQRQQEQVQNGDNNGDDDETDIEVQPTDNEEDSYEDLKSYPKLRKIIECLNPLRVPINLIADEYNRW